MTKYKIYFTDIALKNLKRYPQKDIELILKNIELLADNPMRKSNVKKLVKYDISYRMRVGNYRILFERKDNLRVIDIIDILPRKKAYNRR